MELTTKCIKKSEPTTYNFRQVAEIMNIDGVGRNTLMSMLKEIGILYSDGLPREQYVEEGMFEYRSRYSYNRAYPAGSVVGKEGLDFIKKAVNEHIIKNNG